MDRNANQIWGATGTLLFNTVQDVACSVIVAYKQPLREWWLNIYKCQSLKAYLQRPAIIPVVHEMRMKHLYLPCTLCILVFQRTQSAPSFLSITANENIVSLVMETSSWLVIHGNRMPALVAFATMGLFSVSPRDVLLPNAKCRCFVRDSAVHSVLVRLDVNCWLDGACYKHSTITGTMLDKCSGSLKKRFVQDPEWCIR